MQEIIRQLREKDNFYLYTHVDPDGDALGSAFGLYYALCGIGKKACVVLGAPISENFAFLGRDYQVGIQPPDGGVIVSLDCGDRKRIAGLALGRKVDISIDHHLSREDFAAVFYVDATAAATAEIVLTLLESMSISVTKEIANCLYTGITTDTGGFRYENTTAVTHRMAARLLDAGADGFLINRRMFESKSYTTLKAQAICIENMEFYFGGKVALSFITREARVREGLMEADVDGISAIPRSVSGVLAGAFLWEKDDGSIKGSLRSNGDYDVSLVAKKLGGGGHKNASGFGADSLQGAKEAILGYLKELVG